MKQFFKDRSYDMVRMFLNQFAIALFGCVLAISAGKIGNPGVRNAGSVFSILFYLYLLYNMTWDIGYKDKIPTEQGRKPKRPLMGGLISLFANAVNFLFAICISLSMAFDGAFFKAIGGFGTVGGLLIEGMYTGLLSNQVGGVPLNSVWWVWFLLPIPAILTCTLAYQMGIRDIKLIRKVKK